MLQPGEITAELRALDAPEYAQDVALGQVGQVIRATLLFVLQTIDTETVIERWMAVVSEIRSGQKAGAGGQESGANIAGAGADPLPSA
jgi:hypothetical protein